MRRFYGYGRLLILVGSCLISSVAFAQTCYQNIPDNAPASRFKGNGNGTVTDTQTGLIWMRCALGQTWDSQNSTCTGTPQVYDWQTALQKVVSFDQAGGFAGSTDWRLPNIKALSSIASYHCSDPTIALGAFPATPSESFWSSSPVEGYAGYAFALDFSKGHVTLAATSTQGAIRLVRGGG